MSRFNSLYGDRERPSLSWPEDAKRAKQSFRDEVDINHIVDRYSRAGQLPEGNARKMQYADCTLIPDFQDVQNIYAEARSSYESLTAREKADLGSFEAYLRLIAETPSEASEAAYVENEVAQDKPRGEAAEGGHSSPLDVTVPTDSEGRNATPQ